MPRSASCLLSEIIPKEPEILGGTTVFRGTRVLFQNLLDFLEGGDTVGEFLDDFPSVSREQAIATFEHAKSFFVSKRG